MSITIESDLKEILAKFDQKLDKLDQKIDKLGQNVDQKIDKLSQNIDQKIDKLGQDVDQKINRLDGKIEQLSQDVNDVKVSTARLEEKTEGLSKRIESQEFVSRGILVGLIITILGGAAKLFGFFDNP